MKNSETKAANFLEEKLKISVIGMKYSFITNGTIVRDLSYSQIKLQLWLK